MALSPAAASAIQSGSGFLGGLINSIFARRRQKQQFQHNKQMAQYAYQQDLDMWNRQSAWNREMWELQNQYNLPENQMKRLRAAGLNPNLIYGNASAGGTAAGIQSASSPKYQQVRANYDHMPVSMPQMIGLYQNLRQSNAQIDNVKAATDLTKEKALTETVNRSMKHANLIGKGYENRMSKEMARYSAEIAKLELWHKQRDLKNKLLDTFYKRERNDLTETNRKYRQKELRYFEDYGMRSQDRFEYRILMNLLEKSGLRMLIK